MILGKHKHHTQKQTNTQGPGFCSLHPVTITRLLFYYVEVGQGGMFELIKVSRKKEQGKTKKKGILQWATQTPRATHPEKSPGAFSLDSHAGILWVETQKERKGKERRVQSSVPRWRIKEFKSSFFRFNDHLSANHEICECK